MYIQAILSTVQTKLRGKLKLNLNLGICGSGMLRVQPAREKSLTHEGNGMCVRDHKMILRMFCVCHRPTPSPSQCRQQIFGR